MAPELVTLSSMSAAEIDFFLGDFSSTAVAAAGSSRGLSQVPNVFSISGYFFYLTR